MNSFQHGFTLIELMVVVAVIAILSALAIPAFQDYIVRAKISEALLAAGWVKSTMSEAFQHNSVNGVIAAATSVNATPVAEKRSKYVNDVTALTVSPWTVSISIRATVGNGIPTGLNNATITFSPNVQGATPTASSVGTMDWACGSASILTATRRGLSNVAAGTLPAKYAPSECR